MADRLRMIVIKSKEGSFFKKGLTYGESSYMVGIKPPIFPGGYDEGIYNISNY